MRTLVARTLALVCAVAMGWQAPAVACNFCAPVSESSLLSDLDGAETAFVADLIEPTPTRVNVSAFHLMNKAAQEGEVRFVVRTVLRGGAAARSGQETLVPLRIPGEKGGRYLITHDENEARWRGYQLDDDSERFVTGAASLPLLASSNPSIDDAAQRLEFCLPFLGSDEFLLRKAIFAEFSKAPYQAIKQLRPHLDRETVHGWMEKASRRSEEARLVYVLLSLCGNESDVPELREEFEEAVAANWGGTLDGVILAYVALGGAAALDHVDAALLANPEGPGELKITAANALKFLVDYETYVARPRLLESCRHLLDVPETAASLVQDLTRWEDWGALDALLALWETGLDGRPVLKRQLQFYLESCPLPAAGSFAAAHGAKSLAWRDLPDFAPDEEPVRLPGYVLPLRSEGGRVREFLLVPWVGACIHTPAPAPDQIVHVASAEGIEPRPAFDPVWIEGRLRAEPAQHRLYFVDGSADIDVGYALELESVGDGGDAVRTVLAEAPVPDADAGSWWERAQASLAVTFTRAMGGLDGAGSIGAFGWAVLVCFAYGVLHTLGPGHGKSVVIAYFAGEGGSPWRGVFMGAQIAVFHVLSAVVVVLATDLAVRAATGGQGLSDFTVVRQASYAAIVAIGAVMLWRAVRGWCEARHAPGHHHEHGHDHSHAGCDACAAVAAAPAPADGSRRAMTWLSLAVGAVPCTGALLVLLFGVANDALFSAVFLVVAISAGMAVTLAAIGVLTVIGRRAVGRAAAGRRVPPGIAALPRVLGAAAVVAVGVVLFAVSTTSPGLLPAGAGVHGAAGALADAELGAE